jgi:hypothetical protein
MRAERSALRERSGAQESEGARGRGRDARQPGRQCRHAGGRPGEHFRLGRRVCWQKRDAGHSQHDCSQHAQRGAHGQHADRRPTYNVATSTFANTGGFTNLFVAAEDAFGNNEIWFTDGNNQIWRLDNGVFHQTSGFALTITGSANGTMYFSDGINQVWQQTDFGGFTNTGGFASHISGSPATTALFFSDGINQLWEFFNGGFIPTGGFASNFLAL